MRLGQVVVPGWKRWAAPAAITWALVYGAIRAAWALDDTATPPPMGIGPVALTGWWPVVLCAAAAAVVLTLRGARWRRELAVAAWAVSLVFVAGSARLLLDLVGILLPGSGVLVDRVAFLSSAASMALGVLVAATALCYQRHWRGACLRCGTLDGAIRSRRPPWWAWLAAWTAVAGCLVRLLVQAAVGFGSLLALNRTVLLFEVGFLLVGTVLPLALVYPWGRVFPRWLPPLAGRKVPRGLVLIPALGLGAGMSTYFAVSIGMVAVETLTGTWEQPDSLPLWFFWVAMTAYLVWGLGLLVAGLAYRQTTRPSCRSCGR